MRSVALISNQPQYLWYVITHVASIEDRVDAARALRDMAIVKNNFKAVLSAVDLDHLQRLADCSSVDNRILARELKTLREILTAHSFADIEKIDMAPIRRTLAISDCNRLDELNNIVAMMGLTPITVSAQGLRGQKPIETTPMWYNQSLTIDKKTTPHMAITLVSEKDCTSLQWVFKEIGIQATQGVITRQDGVASPNSVYVQNSELSKLTNEKCEWAAIAYASKATLLALNRTVEIACLIAIGESELKPKWRLNPDPHTNHKAFAYLEARYDHALVSYSDGLSEQNIHHSICARGPRNKCLIISRKQFFQLSNERIEAVARLYNGIDRKHMIASTMGPRNFRDELPAHGYKV